MKIYQKVSLLCLAFILFLLVNSTASADIYDDAVASVARSAKDKEVDERRKPAEILRFFEVKPGMQVFDVFAGGGYYSEIVSNLVGPEGSVVLYNNQPWDDFVKKSVDERLEGDRLPNVKRLIATPESLLETELKSEERYDSAIFILGIHDLYYSDVKAGWVEIDRPKFLAGIHHLLKKGAVFGVIDANAEEGADNEVVGKKLHRVDPEVMIKDILAAGFTLESESDLLRNPDDDKNTSVFNPENRYRTDRTVLKFRK